jgi:23S rRNA pseudouridine1911/1915/1917 synthase
LIRLVDHLKALGYTNHSAREALRTGKVRVAGWPTADPARPVDPAQVTVDPNAPRIQMGRDVLVVWRDETAAVVLKPPGLLSVAAPGRPEDDTVVGQVARAFGRAFTVHRLDEGTSGLLLVGLSEPAREKLKDQFAAHTVERAYLALVRGEVTRERWTVQNQLVRDRGDGRRGSGRGGVDATTHFERVGPVCPGVTMVRARLESGRTHQVRIHLAEGGNAVLGDMLYARGGPRVPRLALHAAVLGFDHVVDGRRLRWEAPLADDLAAWIRERTAGPSDVPLKQG